MLDPGATYPFPRGAPLRQTLPPQRIDPPQPPLVASPLASLLRHTWSPPLFILQHGLENTNSAA